MALIIINILILMIYNIIDIKKILHNLQQNRYNEDNRYLKWISKNKRIVFVRPIFLFILIFLLSYFGDINIILIISILFNIYLIISFRNYLKKEQVKKPLVNTARIKRLWATIFIIYFVYFLIIFINYNEKYINYYLLILYLLIYLNYFMVYLANIINIPVEKYVYLSFKRKANKKLKSLSNMEVIGITGSYGKTSTKNFLYDILNEKYIVFKTPLNYNTSYGLIRTINQYIDKYNDYFIAEMGTLKKNDIKTEASIVKPKYGILTTIGTAHLDSFKTIENIAKEKFDLIESLPSDGIAILNKDDKMQVNYQLKNNCKICWYGIENKDADVVASDIEYSSNGMSFNVTIENKKYEFKTKILGTANIYNILAGITLAKELGVSIEEMQRGVLKIVPVEHRLQLKKYGDINYIDDAYNSNPIGSKMALDVLNLMPGKKIVITPGMIELADKQYEYNYNFGTYIADVADLTILVGEKQTIPIKEGLISKKYDLDKLKVVNDVKDAIAIAQTYFKGEVYILLENDLPDIFNER